MDFVPDAAQPADSWNPHAERASSNFDVRQRVQWYWSYNLPKFSTLRWLTNGWALDGIFNFATGQPYTVVDFVGAYDPTAGSGSGEGWERPNVDRSQLHVGTGGLKLLNMAAFSAPNGTPGNAGRNEFNSPNYTNFDLSVAKTSHLTETLTMQLRADAFNIFNHPNFTNPLLPNWEIDAFGSGAFLQPTATPDVATGNPFLGGGGPRGVQLAAHFNF
jgi:hypothetical protein